MVELLNAPEKLCYSNEHDNFIFISRCIEGIAASSGVIQSLHFFSYHLVWIRISNVLSLPLVQATKSYVMALETMNLKLGIVTLGHCNRPVQL